MAIMRDIMRGIMRDIMRGVMDGIGGIARIFYAPLTNSLIPTTAVDKTYTFTRNDTDATVTDFEGLVKDVTANEARFVGARRVHNLATGLVTETITVISGREYQVTIAGGSGDTAVASNAFTGTLTADGTNRISWNSGTPKTAATTSLTLTVTGTLTQMLVEDVTGQTNQNPSENVEIGAEHGTNVGNVKYFNYENGNTVSAGGVITEASGGAIADATLKGVLIEEARTNEVTFSQDFSNAAWGMINGTKTPGDEPGVQGDDTAVKILNNVGITECRMARFVNGAIGNGAGDIVSASGYLRKQTGKYGYIRIDNNTDLEIGVANINLQTGAVNGVLGVISASDVSVEDISDTYWRVIIRLTLTSANVSISFYAGPAKADNSEVSDYYNSDINDFIHLDSVQIELGPFHTSYIPTVGAAATRNVEALSYPDTNFTDTEGTVALEFTPNGSTAQYVSSAVDRALVGVRGTNIDVMYIDDVSGEIALADGTSVTTITAMPSLVAGTSVKLAGRWSAISSLMKINQDGTENEAAFDGSMDKSTDFRIGYAGANRANGTYKNISLYDGAVDDSTLTGLTS